MKKDRSPTCTCCGGKFTHDNAGNRCRQCGLPDEVAAQGQAAVRAWAIGQGLVKPGASTSNRRRRAHGRARGGRRRAHA